MSHTISAIILKGKFDSNKAKYFDLIPIFLSEDLTLFHIDHYYSSYWNYKLDLNGVLETYNINSVLFPKELSIAEIIIKISIDKEDALYTIIQTDYFGGQGTQYANVYKYKSNVAPEIRNINEALKILGITRTKNKDEFKTVGLDKIRTNPEYLDKYFDLLEEYE